MVRTIGIDLGTTYSAMAYVDIDGTPKVINNKEGDTSTPSVVTWREKEDGNVELIVGTIAKNQAVINPDNTINSIKRMMGKDFKLSIRGEEYTPEEISARILMKLKKDAEDSLGEVVENVVISVPAYFRDGERKATRNAAIIAGWDSASIEIKNEPDCAAVAFGLDRHLEEGKILVFDLGGGTFDVTILKIVEGIFNVVTNDGERLLGGNDFDNRIINYLVEEFKTDNDVDLREDKEAMQRIAEKAEIAKNALSSSTSTEIHIPFIVPDRRLDIKKTLTREKFNELTKDLVEKTVEIVQRTYKNAGVDIDELDKIVMVGGCSRIPAVNSAIKELFPDKKILLFDPDLAIARGAAIYATILFEPKTEEEKEKRKKILNLMGPGEIVASHALGVDAIINGEPGMFSIIIEKDSHLPAAGEETYSTCEENQSTAHVMVYEGEKEKAADNHYLGELIVSEIPPAPKGTEKVEVTFRYAMDNTLQVFAKILSTGKVVEADIDSPTRISNKALMAMKDKADKDRALMSK
jgi:molecular chaperone DnaK